ncbi:hypothetical protein M3676_09135 [Metabacillus litoralis]|nr:hypothetical protein [Metabacillus litoralis]
MRGCPYDKAVAEATFKAFKTISINGIGYESLGELNSMFTDIITIEYTVLWV